MRVLLIGLGLVGVNICRILASSSRVSELICCDKSLSKINSIKSSLLKLNLYNDFLSNVEFKELNASRIREIEKLAKRADIVINAALPIFNIKIMKACLNVGVNYLDLASNDYAKAEQLSLHEDFIREGLTAIINSGFSPGLTNLMAKWCSEVLTEIEVLKIRLIEDQIPYWRIWSWSPYLTIEHFASPPIVYENGRFKIEEPLGGVEEYVFPSPIGKKRTYLIYGDEIATIPNYIKVRKLDLKSGGSEIEFIKGLYNLGLFKNNEIKIGKKRIAPLRMLYELSKKFNGYNPMDYIHHLDDMVIAVSLEAIGVKGGEKSMVRIHALPPSLSELLSKNVMSTPTAFSAAAVSSMLIESFHEIIKNKGVYPLEALEISLVEKLLSNLSSHYNIKVIYEPIKIIKDVSR
ncbi:MAG: saccharopine dehydrogenase NADP-binding domain-containing protein [Candidatus Methanomethylicia archaeon]